MAISSYSNKMLRRYRLLLIPILIVLTALLSGCGETLTETPPPTVTAELVAPTTAPATDSPPPTDAPTPLPPVGVLVTPEGVLDWQAASIQEMLQSLSLDTGMVWEMRAGLSPSELPPGAQLVVALYPTPNLDELVAANPDLQFLAIGIPDLTPAPNLSRIDGDGFRIDQQAFLAGYLAAVITEDWRVGVISESGVGRGQAARLGFQNGARYFCGLCRPVFPPFENYPLFVQVPTGASTPDWLAAADLLFEKGVKTIYLAPGIDQAPLREYLAENGVLIIGSAPRGGFPETHWAAGVHSAPEMALFDLWPALSAGNPPEPRLLPLVIADVNESGISPGRLEFIEALVPDLQSGIVDSGVDPLTGEPR